VVLKNSEKLFLIVRGIKPTDSSGQSGDPITTREPPLVITSPGPVVPYPTRGNVQRPTHSTPPIEEPRESEENEEEGERDDQVNRPEEQIRQPDDNQGQNQGTEKSEEVTNDEDSNRDQEEETEEPEEEEQSTSKNTDDQESDDKDNDAEGTRKKRMGIKITKSVKNVTTSKQPEKDKSGNLDEDIVSIEKEFGHLG